MSAPVLGLARVGQVDVPLVGGVAITAAACRHVPDVAGAWPRLLGRMAELGLVIDSLSPTPDSVLRTTRTVVEAEHRLGPDTRRPA